MRKTWILGGLALSALAVTAWWLRNPPPPTNLAGTAATEAEKPAPAAAPAAGEAPVAQSPATVPPAAALPELPTRAVSEWRTHVVPEDTVPPPAKPLDLRQPSTGTPTTRFATTDSSTPLIPRNS